MRLQQGQVWKKGDDYYRIVHWARHAIEYKHMTDLETKEGSFHELSKKEFCRLLKGAELLAPDAPAASNGGETGDSSGDPG